MDILQMTRELAKAIQADDRYVALSLATTASDNDKDLQEQIGKFNLTRLNLNNEMMKGEEADKERMQQLNKELGEIYEVVMANPHMKVVAGAQKDLDNLLKQINTILTGAMSGQDPDMIDVTIVEGGGCSGNCASCSSNCGE